MSHERISGLCVRRLFCVDKGLLWQTPNQSLYRLTSQHHGHVFFGSGGLFSGGTLVLGRVSSGGSTTLFYVIRHFAYIMISSRDCLHCHGLLDNR